MKQKTQWNVRLAMRIARSVMILSAIGVKLASSLQVSNAQI